MSELAGPKKRTKGQQKKKGAEDNLSEAGIGGGIGGVSKDDSQPAKKRRRQKGDKTKGLKDDDLVEGTITGIAPSKSKKRRNKKEDTEHTTTNQ